VARQYLQLADDQRQLAVVGMLEVEAYLVRPLDNHRADIRIVLAVHRVTFFDEDVEAELDILGGQRLAVIEACLRAQVETHETVVRVALDALGQQAVLGKRLIGRMEGQRVVEQA